MSKNRVFAAAVQYHALGWPCIPVTGKTPGVPWKAYQRRRPTIGQLKEWFSVPVTRPFNIAILTGKVSGLVVVDCDTTRDADWWQNTFPATPLVSFSGGGGRHFYYRHPGEHIGNRTRVLERQIDIRGDGGLVVAPPSIHFQTKQAYRWDNEHWDAVAIPCFSPSWILQSRRKRSSNGWLSRHHDQSVRNGIAYIRRIEALSGQGGHRQTFRAACKLRDSGLSPEDALEALIEWNETNASPPWTERELAHKIEDAFRRA